MKFMEKHRNSRFVRRVSKRLVSFLLIMSLLIMPLPGVSPVTASTLTAGQQFEQMLSVLQNATAHLNLNNYQMSVDIRESDVLEINGRRFDIWPLIEAAETPLVLIDLTEDWISLPDFYILVNTDTYMAYVYDVFASRLLVVQSSTDAAVLAAAVHATDYVSVDASSMVLIFDSPAAARRANDALLNALPANLGAVTAVAPYVYIPTRQEMTLLNYGFGMHQVFTRVSHRGFFTGWDIIYHGSAPLAAPAQAPGPTGPFTFMEIIAVINTVVDGVQHRQEIRVSAQSYPPAGGHVTIPQVTHSPGGTASISATPNTGWQFVGWYEGGFRVSNSANWTFVIGLSDRRMVARFAPIITINVTPTPAQGGSAAGGGAVNPDTQRTLSATPATGWSFVGFYENNVRLSPYPQWTFTVAQPPPTTRTIQAMFGPNINVTSTVGGAASVTAGGATGPHNRSVTVTAVPESGSTFDGWFENGARVNSNLEWSFVASHPRTIQARFITPVPDTTILAHAVPAHGGTAAVTAGLVTGPPTRTVTVTATPAGGWVFVGWYENDHRVFSSRTWTFVASTNRNLQARFAQQTTVTVAPVPAAGGTAVITSGGSTGTANRLVTVQATPNANWQFAGWYEGGIRLSTQRAFSVQATANRHFEARFGEIPPTTVTVLPSSTGGGSGAVTAGMVTGPAGRQVTVTAVPTGSWHFDGWFEGGHRVSSSNPWTFEATANRTLDPRFIYVHQPAVTVFPTPGPLAGTANVTQGGPSGVPGPQGRPITIFADAFSGWQFTGWYEDGTLVSTSQTFSFTIGAASRTLEARFVELTTVTLTAYPAQAGSASVTSGGATGHINRNVTVTAAPNPSWQFTGWYEDGAMIHAYSPWTFSAVENRALEARFVELVNISVTAAAGGTATGGGTFVIYSDVTLIASPNAIHTFRGWYRDGVRVYDSATWSFAATESKAVEARFAPNRTIQITNTTGGWSMASMGVGGAVLPGAVHTVVDGTIIALEAIPHPGYRFDGWYEANLRVYSGAIWEFAVTRSMTLQPRFARVARITATANPATGGQTSGVSPGVNFFDYGVTVRLTAIQNIEYIFSGWYEGNTRVSDEPLYSFVASADRVLHARFLRLVEINVSAHPGNNAGFVVFVGETVMHELSATVLHAAPVSGMIFTGWYEDGVRVYDDATWSFAAGRDRTLEARFAPGGPFTVTATTGPATGFGSVNGAMQFSQSYGLNEWVTLAAVPSPGGYPLAWTFVGWYENDVRVSTRQTWSFTAVAGRTFAPRFIQTLPGDGIPPEAINVSPAGGVTLDLGGFDVMQTFTASIEPANACNQNVTWVSSNPGVAAVSASGTGGRQGTVSAVAVGETTITVASVAAPDVQSSFTVTVINSVMQGMPVFPGDGYEIPTGAAAIIVTSATLQTGSDLHAKINISIRNNPGFTGLPLRISVPASLGLVGYELGSSALQSGFTGPDGLAPGAEAAAPLSGEIFVHWGGNTVHSDDGLLLSLFFAADTQNEGEHGIDVAFATSAGIDQPTNAQGQGIDMYIGNILVRHSGDWIGIINVVNFMIGDTNNDGMLGIADQVRLARFLAGHDVNISDLRTARVTLESVRNSTLGVRDLVRLARFLAGHDVYLGW